MTFIFCFCVWFTFYWKIQTHLLDFGWICHTLLSLSSFSYTNKTEGYQKWHSFIQSCTVVPHYFCFIWNIFILMWHFRRMVKENIFITFLTFLTSIYFSFSAVFFISYMMIWKNYFRFQMEWKIKTEGKIFFTY